MAVKVKIGGDSTGAERALKDTRKGMKGLASDGKATGDSVAVGFIKAQVALAGAQLAAKALAGAFKSVAVGAISVGADMQSFEVQLETLLGSSDAAAERIQTLFEIGSSTPFQLDQLVAAEVKLEAFGVTGDRARTAVMDLAAFMNGDLIGAADAVGRAFQGGAGAADILRDKGVLAMVELKAGIKPTELSLEEFRETLIDTLTDPNGKIAGGTAKLAETFKGLVSNLGDEWFKFQKEIADAGAFDAAQAALIEILRLIDDNRAELGEAAAFISEAIADGVALSLEILKRLPQIAHEASAVARIMSAVFVVSSMQKFVNFTPNMIGSLRAIKLSLGPLGLALIGLEVAYEAATLGAMAFEEQARAGEERSMRASKARIAQINAEIAAAQKVENTLEVQVLLQGGQATEEQMIRIAAVNEQIGSLQSEQYAQGETLRIQEEHRADNADAVAEALAAAAKAAEEATDALGGTDKVVTSIADSVEDIAGSPLFSESDIKKITKEIEKAAGIYDQQAEDMAVLSGLHEDIRLSLEAGLVSQSEAERLEALLIIAAMDRLGVEEDITAEKRAQLEADEKLTAQMAAGSAVASGISGGPEALLTSGAGMAGVWGAIIMAALQGGQRNAEGEFEMVAQNEQFQALVENFADGIGDLIVDLTRQVPKHLADAFKTAPELAENLMKGINEAAPELAPALIKALSEGMSDPERGIELARMLIRSLIQAGEEIPAALAFMVVDWAVETVERIIDVWNGGLEELGDNIAQFFIDIIENLTGLDLDNSDSPGASGKSRDDDSGNRAGRTVAGSAGSDSDSGLTVVNVSLSADAEQLGLGLLVESNAALRRNMLTPYSVPTSIVTQKTDPTGALP